MPGSDKFIGQLFPNLSGKKWKIENLPNSFWENSQTNKESPREENCILTLPFLDSFFFFNFCKFDMQRMTSGFNTDFSDPCVYSSLMNCKCLLSIFSVGLVFSYSFVRATLKLRTLTLCHVANIFLRKSKWLFFFILFTRPEIKVFKTPVKSNIFLQFLLSLLCFKSPPQFKIRELFTIIFSYMVLVKII